MCCTKPAMLPACSAWKPQWEQVEPDLDITLTTAISKLLCVFLAPLIPATTIKTHKLQRAFFCPSWCNDITHAGCIKYLFCLTLQLDWHLLLCQHAGRPLCSMRLKGKAQSRSCVFALRHIFTTDFRNTVKQPSMKLPGWTADKHSRVRHCFPWPPSKHSAVTSSMSSFSTGKCHLCCAHPPFKRIAQGSHAESGCLATLRLWPTFADDFSKLPS